jgi:hypothetical protein
MNKLFDRKSNFLLVFEFRQRKFLGSVAESLSPEPLPAKFNSQRLLCHGIRAQLLQKSVSSERIRP